MQIVIDISDNVYGLLRYFKKGLGLSNKKDDSDDVKTALMRVVVNGTPLPKNHGRLIDADELFWDIQTDEQMRLGGHLAWIKERIDNAPTIIEADTESEG